MLFLIHVRSPTCSAIFDWCCLNVAPWGAKQRGTGALLKLLDLECWALGSRGCRVPFLGELLGQGPMQAFGEGLDQALGKESHAIVSLHRPSGLQQDRSSASCGY